MGCSVTAQVTQQNSATETAEILLASVVVDLVNQTENLCPLPAILEHLRLKRQPVKTSLIIQRPGNFVPGSNLDVFTHQQLARGQQCTQPAPQLQPPVNTSRQSGFGTGFNQRKKKIMLATGGPGIAIEHHPATGCCCQQGQRQQPAHCNDRG